MDSKRFSPERDFHQAVLLQKQIYQKEEKALGLSKTPEKLKFEQFIKVLNPSVISRPGIKKSQEAFMPMGLTQDSSVSTKVIHKRFNTQYRDLSSPVIKNTSLENVYRDRIAAATQFKEKYDFNNPSPITWFGKEAALSQSIYRPKNQSSIQNIDTLYNQLNSKRIPKGMGYVKSNIFS